MTHLDEAEAFIARRLRPVSDMPLFAEAGATDGRANAQMPGAGQAARADARARARTKLTATYTKLALCLEAYPSGLTRKELAEMSGVPVNTVNARISEMRGFLPMGEDPLTWPYAVFTEGRRGTESIVRLARLALHEEK